MLTVTLNKTEPITTWNSLSKSEEILPTDLPVQPIREMPMTSAVNLRSEMEECDFGDEDMECEYTFGKCQSNKVLRLETNSIQC